MSLRLGVPRRALAGALALLGAIGTSTADAATPRAVDEFRGARTSLALRSLATDGERFAAWQRPNGATLVYDARAPRRVRTLRPPAGFRLAAVGDGRILWERASTFTQSRPTESALVAADATSRTIGAPVRFVATFGSGPLCPLANSIYGGITDAGSAGAIVTCLSSTPAQPWRFSVDPRSGVSTAPHFAPAELVGKVWAWNADLAGIQVVACDTVAAAPAFAAASADEITRRLAYEAPFAAGPRWDRTRQTARPGAELHTCGTSRPVVLTRTGSPSAWQFGGRELSWVSTRRSRGGQLQRTAYLYDLRAARVRVRAPLRLRAGSTVVTRHVGSRLLLQITTPNRRGGGATSRVQAYRD